VAFCAEAEGYTLGWPPMPTAHPREKKKNRRGY